MSHVWHELVKVLHRFTYVHLPGPFAFLNTGASRRAVGRTDGCELGTLDREIRQSADPPIVNTFLPTDVGNKSSISELPTRGGPSDSKREDDG